MSRRQGICRIGALEVCRSLGWAFMLEQLDREWSHRITSFTIACALARY